MKATKVVMIAAIMIVAMLSQTAEATSKPKCGAKPIYVTFEQAITNPGLLQAMYKQLNTNFLKKIDKGEEYTVSVIYLSMRFNISGTYTQWYQFFLMKKGVHNTSEISLY